jgi:hypothetical protein
MLLPSVDQMSKGLTQSVVKIGHPEIQKIVNFIWVEVNSYQQWKEPTGYLFKKGDSAYLRGTVIYCIQNFYIILLSV